MECDTGKKAEAEKAVGELDKGMLSIKRGVLAGLLSQKNNEKPSAEASAG